MGCRDIDKDVKDPASTQANACIVGLSAGGAVDIFVDVSTTHVLFDCSGFVI
jgi:hypothetical protein